MHITHSTSDPDVSIHIMGTVGIAYVYVIQYMAASTPNWMCLIAK